MCLNPANEEFDRAYSNVGLFADDIWIWQKELADYKKANLNLWIRFNKVEQRLTTEGSDDCQSTSTEEIIRTVQDTIPFSRLASYNDFPYNEEREQMYFSDNEPAQYIENSFQYGRKDLEVWMTSEVEEEFKRLTHVSSSRWDSVSPRIPTGGELSPVELVTTTSPNQWLTSTTWPDQLLDRYPDLPRALHNSKRLSLFQEEPMLPSYNAEELEEKLKKFPCPGYLIETNSDLALHTLIDIPNIRDLWSQHLHYGGFSPCFSLNADVPEFQPVTVRQQQYTSIYDTSYETDLFPYSQVAEVYQLQPEVVPICIYSEVPQQVQNIPVFLRPPESYYNVESVRPTWKNHQGAVLSNLVPLTGSEQCADPCKHVATVPTQIPYDVSGTKIPNTQKMLEFLDKWLNKVYNPRSSDFSSMSSTTCRIDKIFQNVQHNYRLTQDLPPGNTPATSHRPLYSDVLMNDVAAVSCSDRQYDELEREAMEQYSGSDTTLQENLNPPLPHTLQDQRRDVEESQPCPSYCAVRQGAKRRVRLDDSSPRHSDSLPRSAKHDNSPSPGSKRSSLDDASQNSCSPNKQAMWMKKKKKKTEKKKKHPKQTKKPTSDHHNNCEESEVLSIRKFEELKPLFLKTFFEQNWKLVQEFLTEEIVSTFNSCLKMIKECLEWFSNLVMNKQLKEDFRSNKKRLKLAENVVNTLHELFGLLHHYISRFSKIKMTIPCDHRLYFDPDKLVVQKALVRWEWEDCKWPNGLDEEECCYTVRLLETVFKGKNIPKLLSCNIVQESLALISKREWKLPLNPENSANKKYSCIRMVNKEGYFRMAVDRKEEPLTRPTRKIIRIVDSFPIWYNFQWRFADGWMFGREGYTFSWMNRFNVGSLENVTSSAVIFIIYDWVFEFIDAISLKKSNTSYEPLWNISQPNLISNKMMFMKLLLKREEGWCFGDIRINKQACLPWLTGCENPCCVSWLLNPTAEKVTVKTNDLQTKPLREGQKITVSSQRTSEKKKEEAKSKESNAKSKIPNKLSPDKQLILNQIASGEINLPSEKPQLGQHSSCCMQ